MTKNSGGPTINQGGASTPTQEERDRAFAGITGNAEEKGEKPSPDDRERGETSSADDGQPPIDLESAHDRAS
jgi:hypothetical protein